MCEFCASHGGKTRWYLNPDNFSKDLLEDKKRMKVPRFKAQCNLCMVCIEVCPIKSITVKK
ncbi:MAG TPA: hypothetical protein VMV49_18740 [Candidatus Deferrimicrobium sp.]|nr:hypothetical protein [Candidatus Deferrimicrobium sp.]